MAIDKNSKAYQNLLNNGYSDQQITDMYNQASSGQSRQEVVANTQPVNTPTTQSTTPVEQPTEQPTQQPTQTTPEVKQETKIKQQETVGSTVPEIKQQGELKPLSQDYYNQTGDDAQKKIRDNLNLYRETNPGLFSDYESFKKNFSYDARNEEQKQTLDAWYGEYEKGMQLSGVPTTDLYTQYKDGQVSTSDLETLKIYNPTKYAELQNQINKGNIIAAYDDDKGVDTTGMSLQDMAYQYTAQLFQRFMNGDSSSTVSQYFDNYKNNVNSPEMLEIQDKTTDLQEQIENLNDDRARIKKEVEKEYEGTGATRSKINAIIADRSYELDLQLRTLNSEYTKYATQYNNRMNQYQSEFQMQLQEYQLNQDARNQQMKELGFAMDLMNFETNEQKAQREWDYWVKQQEYTNGNINSKDYDTRYKAALKSVQNLLSQYEGIPMLRSAEQMAQDILTAIDGGSDLGAELTKINKQIQSKPEYKYLYNQTFKPASASGFNLESYKVGDTEYVVYNGEMMTAEDFNSKYGGKAAGATGEAKPYDIVDASVFDMGDGYQTKAGTLGAFLSDPSNASKKTGGWCGAFVNKYLKSIGVTNQNYYDDSLETKLNSVNTQIPKVGSIAVYDYGHITKETGKNHGHVGIVTKVYEDGSYDVIDSNFGSDKKIQVRQHLNPQSSNCKGFFDPSQPPAGSNTTDVSTSNLSTQDQQKASAMLKQIRSGAMTNSDMSSARDWLIENGYGEEFEEALDKGLSIALTDTQQSLWNNANNNFKSNYLVQEFEKSINQFENLAASLNDASGVGDMSAVFTFMKTLDPSSVVRESEFESAANTAGILNWRNIYTQVIDKNFNGEFLTPKQREDFKKIAKQFIKNAAANYNVKYDDLKKTYANAGIDEQWLPTNMADLLISKIDNQTTNQSTYQSTQSTVYTPSWATKYQNNSSTGGGSTVTVNGNSYPSDFYSNN